MLTQQMRRRAELVPGISTDGTAGCNYYVIRMGLGEKRESHRLLWDNSACETLWLRQVINNFYTKNNSLGR
jgi:hypothetical protein